MLHLHAAEPGFRQFLVAATVAVLAIAAPAPLAAAQPVPQAGQEVCGTAEGDGEALRWANQCDLSLVLADIRLDRPAPLIKADTSRLRLRPDDPALAESIAPADALERLQADADAVVSILGRLERQGRSLQAIAHDRRLSDELRLAAAKAEGLRLVLAPDTRVLAAAIDDVFARGLANLPELGAHGDRYHGLTVRLAHGVDAVLVHLSDIEALKAFGSALELHQQRLRERQTPPERIAALEREAEWIDADRGERLSSLTDAARALEESLRILGETTCEVYRRLDVHAACRAREFVARLSDIPQDELAYYLLSPPREAAVAAMARLSERILHSVYGYFDQKTHEPEGYGLYTYVLFVRGSQNEAFVQELIDSTDVAGEISAADRRQINLFSLPVKDAPRMPEVLTDAAWLLDRVVYDYSTARSFLLRLCANPAAARLGLCAGSEWRGPYLLTHPRPQSQLDVLELPYLFVDLSHVRERAYGEFIRAVKEQVTRPDFTDRERIDTFRLRLLNITLTAADWVRPIQDGVREIIFTSD